ncbi:MAG: GMC family oxidoreductase [Bacteroidetes bacterium]|nr:MAG: GMC family oxidoreductase [Bacteroidota bacterium]
MKKSISENYDYVIVGSGFGGSVSALRLSEKGYKVLVIEKGKWWKPSDFPKTNWNLRKWLWIPSLRFFGFFKMTFLKHVGILSGVGVGGGSLVYANTLPRPKDAFFKSGSWKGIADWKSELEPFYREAEKMLGATTNPKLFDADNALKEVATQMGHQKEFEPTDVAVFFGEPEITVPDPFFNGKGPERSGCTHCGACMTGCRYNAKNTLDKNYLYLAMNLGAEVVAEHIVTDVRPDGAGNGSDGYVVSFKKMTGLFSKSKTVKAKGVVMAGGVLGTIRLLLDMKTKGLPNLSHKTGDDIRTNNESLILVHSRQKEKKFSEGVAIGSIFPPDEDSHVEPVRYGSGSGFFKLMGVPMILGKNGFTRTIKLLGHFIAHPASSFRIYFSKNFAEESVILLFMQHLNSTLQFKKGLFNLGSRVSTGKAPSSFIPRAKELAVRTSQVINGKPYVMTTEVLFGIPTTAHILGGAVIGESSKTGVIDKNHRVFGYENMYVCDGSAISANPGVNPSLTITAMSERAMSLIPEKREQQKK